MEFTYENITKWLDGYFATFNGNAGPLETVPNMKKFFAPELEFWSYNMPNGDRPSTREALLMTMVHPGLHEELTPREYIVDLKRMVVVVQFQLQFTDEPSGKVWPPKQASAHYTFKLDENKNFKIKKIQYWTEAGLPEESAPMMELWHNYRNQANTEFASKWISEHD